MAAQDFDDSLMLWAGMFIALGFFVLVTLPRRRPEGFRYGMACFFCCLGFGWGLPKHDLDSQLPPPHFVAFDARLESLRTLRKVNLRARSPDEEELVFGYQAQVVVLKSAKEPTAAALPAKLRVRLPADLNPQPNPGQKLRLFGRMLPRPERWICHAVVLDSNAGSPHNAYERLADLRGYCRDRIRQCHSGFTARTLQALLLGQSDFRRDERNLIKRAGALHWFVVSGMHLGLLAAFCHRIALFLRFGETVRLVGVFGMAAAYALLTGLEAPVLRALLALFLFSLSRLRRRHFSPCWCYFAVAFLTLIQDPMLAREAGFQLSFAAVGGIFWLSPHRRFSRNPEPLDAFLMRKKSGRRLRPLGYLLNSSYGALLGTAGLSLFHFGSFAPASLVSSITLLPFVIALIFLGFVEQFVALPEFLMAATMRGMTFLLHALGGIPGGYLEMPSPPLWATLVTYLILATAALLPPSKERWRILLPPLAIVALIITALAAPGQLERHFQVDQVEIRLRQGLSRRTFRLFSWDQKDEQPRWQALSSGADEEWAKIGGRQGAVALWHRNEERSFLFLRKLDADIATTLCRLALDQVDYLVPMKPLEDPKVATLVCERFRPRAIHGTWESTELAMAAAQHGARLMTWRELMRNW